MRISSRPFMALAALCLATGGAVHALAYPKAAAIAENSALPRFFSAAFEGLWLSDAASSISFALAFGAIAVWPRLASRALVVLLALAPLASAATIYATMGSFFAGHLMLLAGSAVLIGGALHRHPTFGPRGPLGGDGDAADTRPIT